MPSNPHSRSTALTAPPRSAAAAGQDEVHYRKHELAGHILTAHRGRGDCYRLCDVFRDSDDHQFGGLLAKNGKVLVYGLYLEARYGRVEFHEPRKVLCIENSTNRSRIDHHSSSRREVYILENADSAPRTVSPD